MYSTKMIAAPASMARSISRLQFSRTRLLFAASNEDCMSTTTRVYIAYILSVITELKRARIRNRYNRPIIHHQIHFSQRESSGGIGFVMYTKLYFLAMATILPSEDWTTLQMEPSI